MDSKISKARNELLSSFGYKTPKKTNIGQCQRYILNAYFPNLAIFIIKKFLFSFDFKHIPTIKHVIRL